MSNGIASVYVLYSYLVYLVAYVGPYADFSELCIQCDTILYSLDVVKNDIYGLHNVW